ncbi:hypothetical protein KKG72_05130 [bacterium]|nr:hypothetical protein [bacterium]MBU1995420.1 hypothetical protein [bacterium]
MNFSINSLSSLAKLISANPNETSSLIKLVSLEVLKSLGDGKYTILLENKTLTAQSDKTLSEGSKYWSQLTQTKNESPQLSHLMKMPQILKNTQNTALQYSLKEVQALLNSKQPQTIMKQNLLEQLSTAGTKEEFSNISTLLLSLQNHTLTIPLRLQNYYSLLQIKKRYNNKSKKTQINFYAALEFLGPISGVVVLDETKVSVNLNVAFMKTKNYLEDDMKNFSHNINISILNNIEPLYNANTNSLLDIVI